MNRETIFLAVYNLAASTAGIITSGRRVKHWDEVPAELQPALFQGQGDEDAQTRPGRPTIWTLYAHLYLYVNSGSDPTAYPATQINSMLDAIEAAFKPAPNNDYNTLGGLVFDCRIDGKIQTDEGLLGPQSVAVIPIKITVVE